VLELALQTLVALAAVVAWAAYVLGWFRLRTGGYTAPRWRVLLYGLGLASLVAALLPPIEHLASARFSAHMGQHLLLTQVAAPLLVLGNPLPLVLWGLPRRVRRPLAATLRRGKPVRTALAALTFLPVWPGLPGWIYASLGPLLAFNGWWHGRQVRALVAQMQTARAEH